MKKKYKHGIIVIIIMFILSISLYFYFNNKAVKAIIVDNQQKEAVSFTVTIKNTGTSTLVKTQQFESASTPTAFTIYIDGSYVYGGVTQNIEKSAGTTLLIKPDPSVDFTINIQVN